MGGTLRHGAAKPKLTRIEEAGHQEAIIAMMSEFMSVLFCPCKNGQHGTSNTDSPAHMYLVTACINQCSRKHMWH